MRTMSGGPCPYDCSNRNSFGYCRTTVCINEHYQQEQWGSPLTTNKSENMVKKPKTNVDIIRAMTNEELANFIVYRDCCPGFFTGTFSDANRKKYGFDGRSERCEFGGDECIVCWLNWLREEAKE